MPAKTIEQVMQEHTRELMAIEGVVGVGQGLCDGKDCIKVFVAQESDELRQKIPSQIEGYPVEIVASGPFKATPKK